MRVRDVSVRIERVLTMPHAGKLFIDEPPGEDLVVWAVDGLSDEEIADAVDRYLLKGQPLPGRRFEDHRLFAS